MNSKIHLNSWLGFKRGEGCSYSHVVLVKTLNLNHRFGLENGDLEEGYGCKSSHVDLSLKIQLNPGFGLEKGGGVGHGCKS